MRQQLTNAFGEAAGTVVNVRLPMDRESGELKGIGFIEFESADAKVGARVLQLLLVLPRVLHSLLPLHLARPWLHPLPPLHPVPAAARVCIAHMQCTPAAQQPACRG